MTCRQTAGLLAERLQAWKHAVGYLEEYISATERAHKVQSKEYEKILKTISQPLREGAHFDQALGGVAGLFENMRSNTQVRELPQFRASTATTTPTPTKIRPAAN